MSAPIVWVLRRTSDALYTVSSWFSDAAGSLMSWSNRIVEHKRVKGLS